MMCRAPFSFLRNLLKDGKPHPVVPASTNPLSKKCLTDCSSSKFGLYSTMENIAGVVYSVAVPSRLAVQRAVDTPFKGRAESRSRMPLMSRVCRLRCATVHISNFIELLVPRHQPSRELSTADPSSVVRGPGLDRAFVKSRPGPEKAHGPAGPCPKRVIVKGSTPGVRY